MDHVLAVGVLERIAQRDPDRDDVAVREPPLAEQLIERRAADELGDQVGAVVVSPGLVERDDVRVLEPRGRLRLALETARVDALAQHDLDRHLAVEALVVGLPHRAEAAGAEPALQAVAPEHDRRLAVRLRRLARRLGGSPSLRLVRRIVGSVAPRRTVGA